MTIAIVFTTYHNISKEGKTLLMGGRGKHALHTKACAGKGGRREEEQREEGEEKEGGKWKSFYL